MSWFAIALFSTLLWSVSNHIDKYLLSKYFSHKSVGVLMLYSTLFALVIIPILFVLDPAILSVPIRHIFFLILGGVFVAVSIFLYLKALSVDEASIVVPFFQLIPVFGYALAYILLGEFLTTNQILAGLLIIFGATILSLEFNKENKLKLKTKVAYLMLSSCFLIALVEVVFKKIALEGSFWSSVFWNYSGLAIFGLILFLTVKTSRKEFLSSLKNDKKRIISLNCFNELINIIGNIGVLFALLLAPAALVFLVNSYQPLFVFLIGIALTLFFPKIAKEKISLKDLTHKILAILLVLIGSYFLN